MSAVLYVAQLRGTLDRLHELTSISPSAADKQTLRDMLASTIKTLHQLYPDSLSDPQLYRLGLNLNELERQFLAIVPGTDVPPTFWLNVQQSLQETISVTLADVAQAHH